MQVRMLVSSANPRTAWNPGDLRVVTVEEAARLIRAGQAEPVREEREPEKAVRRSRRGERAARWP